MAIHAEATAALHIRTWKRLNPKRKEVEYMKKIFVCIAAEGNLCGECHALGHVDLHGCGEMKDPSCGIFNEDLQKTEDGKAYRGDSCMMQEVTFNLNEKVHAAPHRNI
jgi:hypothetical protein